MKKAAARSGTATVQATRSLVEDWMDKNPKLIVALWAAVSTGSVEPTIESIEQ